MYPEKRRSLQALFFPLSWLTPASLRPRIMLPLPYWSNRITKLSQKSGRWRLLMKKKTSKKGPLPSHIGEFHSSDILLPSRPCSKGIPIHLKVLSFFTRNNCVAGSERFRDCSLDQFKNNMRVESKSSYKTCRSVVSPMSR